MERRQPVGVWPELRTARRRPGGQRPGQTERAADLEAAGLEARAEVNRLGELDSLRDVWHHLPELDRSPGCRCR